MKKIFLPVLIITAVAFTTYKVDASLFENFENFSVEASDNQVFETRKLSSFEGISASSAISIVVVDDTYKGEITVNAPDNVIKSVKTVVEKNVLKIYLDKSVRLMNKQKIEVKIPHRKLRNVTLSGASKLKASHMFKVEDFKFDVSGASSIEMNLTSNKITADLSGASSAVISGNAQRIFADVSGASALKISELKVASATIEASGASSVKIWVVDDLNAEASGASSIKYKSNSNLKLNKKTSGASSVSSF